MICVSIAKPTAKECIAALNGIELAEIRIDKLENPTLADIKNIFSQRTKLVATCRLGLEEEQRLELLKCAIENGAEFVDIELEAKEQYRKQLVETARKHNCKVIISYHDFEKTPKRTELEHIVNWCFDAGADIAKIACKTKSNQENARLLGLLDSDKKMIVIGMGENGKTTRAMAPLLGSQMTFASLGDGEETADGQLPKERLEKLLNVIRQEMI